jgi:ABC-type multidrug transport system fused ATPase/permease subunit
VAVRILKDKLACRAEYALYRRKDNELELTGSPSAYKDGDEYKATRILVNTDTEDIRLEGEVSGSVSDKAAPDKAAAKAGSEKDKDPPDRRASPDGIRRPKKRPEEARSELLGRGRRSHVLEASGLRKLYRKKIAVADVSFSMSTGEVVGLLGPNGAGKTTVFYMIVGFIRPTAGRVSVDGSDISALPMYKRARLGIAYLPQEPSIFRRLSVEDNIRAVLETRSDISDGRKRELSRSCSRSSA